MAPQILQGKEYSIKCDVWSLGVMFYQMLYGFLPWIDNNSIHDLLHKITHDNLQFPPSVQVSQELKDLIQKMLQIDETNRATMKEVDEIITKIHDEICK